MSGDLPAVTEYLGWVATAVFVGSYFCARAEALRRVQMAGAVIWVGYGLLIDASPVVVSNLLVLGAGVLTLSRENTKTSSPPPLPSKTQNA